MNIIIKTSTRKDKKYMAIIDKKKVHFGQKNASDYTIHKDPKRKMRYIKRHQKREDWTKSGIDKAGFYSRWILWNMPTLLGSVRDVNRRFDLKIRLLK